MKKLVCKHCGSDKVELTGWCYWNDHNQRFEFKSIDVINPIKDICHQYAQCNSCDEHGDMLLKWKNL